MKILVRNLARTTTEKELRALFIQHGRVQSCDLVMDKATGKSKGFAFVEMPKAGEAKVAIKKLNNMDVAGDKIRVKKAENKVESKVDADTDVETEIAADNKAEVVEEAPTPVASEETPKKFSWKEKKLI